MAISLATGRKTISPGAWYPTGFSMPNAHFETSSSNAKSVLVWNISPDHFPCVTRSSYGRHSQNFATVTGALSSKRTAVTVTPSNSTPILFIGRPPLLASRNRPDQPYAHQYSTCCPNSDPRTGRGGGGSNRPCDSASRSPPRPDAGHASACQLQTGNTSFAPRHTWFAPATNPTRRPSR